jgi:hypothetical protein
MILDEIVSIKKVGVKKTVDIEVDGPDHLFYCNDILTHNSAAGETNDITEENIQGGISKIQAADNVIGFIPNSHAREVGIMRAKFLKTRDSGGVGKYIDFKVDWSTLTFAPFDAKSEGDGTYRPSGGAPALSADQLKRTDKGKAKPKPKPKEDDIENIENEDVDDKAAEESSGTKTKSVIKSLGGKKKPFGSKKVKLA